MNKTLTQLVSEDINVFKYSTIMLLNSVFKNLRAVICKLGRVNIHGFGTFELVYRPERPARNPATMEEFPVSARFEIRFKPSDEFKAMAQENLKNRGEFE